MRNPFRKKPEPIPVDPLTRLQRAVDEVNDAVNSLPNRRPRIRPWTRSHMNSAPTLCLGYWDSLQEKFVVTYEGKP